MRIVADRHPPLGAAKMISGAPVFTSQQASTLRTPPMTAQALHDTHSYIFHASFTMHAAAACMASTLGGVYPPAVVRSPTGSQHRVICMSMVPLSCVRPTHEPLAARGFPMMIASVEQSTTGKPVSIRTRVYAVQSSPRQSCTNARVASAASHRGFTTDTLVAVSTTADAKHGS